MQDILYIASKKRMSNHVDDEDDSIDIASKKVRPTLSYVAKPTPVTGTANFFGVPLSWRRKSRIKGGMSL